MLFELERELEELEQRRDELDRAIARLRRITAWLRRRNRSRKSHRDQEESGPQSLTNYCRAVLRMTDRKGATPREVKCFLTEVGFDWGRFMNPMAALHTVLKRLVHQGEAVTSVGRDGHRRFAAKRMDVLALTRRDVADDAFLKKLLRADSPESIVELVKARRTEAS